MVTAAGVISEQVVALQAAVAGSPTFQTVTGMNTQALAMDRVKLNYFDVEDVSFSDHDLPRPFAMVDYGGLRIEVLDGQQCPKVAGAELQIYMSMDHVGATHNDGYVTFSNWVGQTLWETVEHGGADGKLNVMVVETLISPRRVSRSQRNPSHDFWDAAYQFVLR